MPEGRITPQDEIELFPIQALTLSLVAPWSAIRKAWAEKTALQSLVYHGIGLFAFFFILTVIDSGLWDGDILDGFTDLGPGELPIALLGFAVWLIVIQLCYFFAALLTCCWGAGHEPFRENFGRSLSRWYQLTPFHAAWTLGLIVAIEFIDNLHGNYWGYNTYSEARHFFYGCLYLLSFMVYGGIGGWYTLRALAVPRSNSAYAPKCRWPAQCETCGYALVGMTREQTCPECGRSVETSFNTPRGNTPHTTLAKMKLALLNPAALGEILQTRTHQSEPAKALALAALALLVTGPIGVFYIYMLPQFVKGDFAFDNGFDSGFDILNRFVVAGLGTGLSAMIIGVTIALGTGSLIGILERLLGKRNSRSAACQAACYASGYAVFLALLMYGFSGVMIVIIEKYFSHLGFGLLAIIPLTLLTVCLLLTLPYCVIVGRIVRAARYANV